MSKWFFVALVSVIMVVIGYVADDLNAAPIPGEQASSKPVVACSDPDVVTRKVWVCSLTNACHQETQTIDATTGQPVVTNCIPAAAEPAGHWWDQVLGALSWIGKSLHGLYLLATFHVAGIPAVINAIAVAFLGMAAIMVGVLVVRGST